MAIRQQAASKRRDRSALIGNLLTPEEAAMKMAVAVQTLAHWRVRGSGPAFIHLSARCVRYPETALDDWLSERLQASTAENPVG